MLLFILIAGFLSGFIDSVVGGGGLISLPALMLTGMPLPLALGTNKFASSFSSLTSTLNYIKNKQIDLPLAKKLFFLSFVGSLIGAYTVTQISPDALRPVVAVLLILITIYTLVKKDWGDQKRPLRRNYLFITMPFIVAIGFYDGFLGPGTGSFFAFLFLYIGFDFVKAAGNSRIMNFASNIAALMLFAFSGHVNYYYGIVMALAMIIGSYLGSTLAIRNGQKYIKPLFILVSCTMIIKISIDWILK